MSIALWRGSVLGVTFLRKPAGGSRRTSPTAGFRYDRPAGGSGATPLAPLAVAARTCARTSHPR